MRKIGFGEGISFDYALCLAEVSGGSACSFYKEIEFATRKDFGAAKPLVIRQKNAYRLCKLGCYHRARAY